MARRNRRLLRAGPGSTNRGPRRAAMTSAPLPPLPRLSLAITGHRATNRAFAANRDAVAAAIERSFARLEALAQTQAASLGGIAQTRLHSLLACGTDLLAAEAAARRQWEIVAPLPFGRQLNLAINALPADRADAEALLAGAAPADSAVLARAEAIAGWYGQARLFELAEQDPVIAPLFLAQLADPADAALAQSCTAAISDRAALAGRVMIEQSDILIAVWDGIAHDLAGGTGHTIAAALEQGTPVIWIDPARAAEWRLLTTPELLHARRFALPATDEQLVAVVSAALRPGEGGALKRGAEALRLEAWHSHSHPLGTGYRRIEALFGGQDRPLRPLRQRYEPPEEIGTGSAAPILALAGDLARPDPAFAPGLERETLQRFAWADGISARLSDSYRSGMIANFLLSALAVAVGIAYQPLYLDGDKWLFALGEFLLLGSIVAITWIGRRRHWHKRWFETRRVAEYFRHAPILQLLGVARPPGRWPRGAETSWPEYYARHGLRALGLPRVTIDDAYLRRGLDGLLRLHVLPQLAYHRAKALRLTTVHHRLDHLSNGLFLLAVASVSTWLILSLLAATGLAPADLPKHTAKLFTFLGVLCPTLGASIAGIRYFGDFERFAAISDVTAEKLEAISQRISVLLAAEGLTIGYAQAADLAHAVDRVVVDEIENWQAVFSGKNIAIPV